MNWLSLNRRDGSLSGEFLKLQGIVARPHAIRGSSQLSHACLVADVGGVVSVGKCRAAFVFGQIAIKLQIVGAKHERRTSFHAKVL